MKKNIGILGGLSPESTVYYYQYLTHEYTKRFGDYSYPKIIIYSVTFQEFLDWGMNREWKSIEDNMVSGINALEAAGAEFAIIATNTLHYVYDAVVERTNIPVLSQVDAVCEYTKKQGMHKVGLLGTKFTMRKPFYSDALAKVGVETMVPDDEGQTIIHDVIFDELSKGVISTDSKAKYIEIINDLASRGAEGVILGCTEIPLLIKPDDVDIHVLDSSLIHAKAALDFALEE
jgi:aspartate racemase